MNTAEVSGQTSELARVWLVLPALWLLVGLGGYVALSQWPQLFA